MAEREQGTVKWFSSSKGYGFITPEEGDDIFIAGSGVDIIDGGNGFDTISYAGEHQNR